MRRPFSSLRSTPVVQRVLALLVTAFVLCSGVSPITAATPGDKVRCASAALAAQTSAQQRERSEDKGPRHVRDAQSGEGEERSDRPARRWYGDAPERIAGSAAWLTSAARGPPKTILYCSLLI